MIVALVASAATARELRTCLPDETVGCYDTIVAAVEASAPGDTVFISAGEYREAVTIDHALTLEADWMAVLLDPPDASDVLTITGSDPNDVVVLKGLRVTTARARPIRMDDAKVLLAECFLTSSGSQFEGGLIRAEGGSLEIDPGSRLAGGTAVDGGQVWASHVDLSLWGTFDGGSAVRQGGCIYVDGAPVVDGDPKHTTDFLFADVVGCGALVGGGVYAQSTHLSFSYGSLAGNIADYGGGLRASESVVTADRLTVLDNSARTGGGMDVGGGDWDGPDSLTFTHGRVVGNRASVVGAGLYANIREVVVEDTVFQANVADAWGGAMAVSRAESFAVRRSRFCGNQAGELGGALHVQFTPLTTVENSVFGENSVSEGTGGALAIAGDGWGWETYAADVRFNTFVGNEARGASVLATAAHVSFSSNLLANNRSSTSTLLAADPALGGVGVPFPTHNVSDEAIEAGWGITGDPGLRRWDAERCLVAAEPAGVLPPGLEVPRDVAWPVADYAGRDAGDPALLDPDGSVADVGAHAGPGSDATQWTVDEDRDGFGPVYDCDDADENVFPGAREVWYDGVDSDCDVRTDFDQDGDGHDKNAGDCDDLDAAISPDALEVAKNFVDEDCRGGPDLDFDRDGWFFPEDCDDTNATVHPGQRDLDPTLDGNCDDEVGSLVAHGCASSPGVTGGLLAVVVALSRRRARRVAT